MLGEACASRVIVAIAALLDRGPPSLGLTAQERGNIEFIFIGRVMHRRLPAVRVEAVRRGPWSVFGDGVLRIMRACRGGSGGRPIR